MGAFMHGGRWTSRGRRVIHAAETYSGALLETLVHCNTGRIPKTQAWIEITCPERYGIAEIKADEIANWNGFDIRGTRALGDRWYEERKALILLVPSVVTAGIERNVLINQDHPDFRHVRATAPTQVQWDSRLFRATVAATERKNQ